MAGSRPDGLNVDSLIYINPTEMTKLQASITQQFLEKCLKEGKGFIYAGEIYENFTYNHPSMGFKGVCNLQFHYSMVLYTTEEHPEKDYFAVIGNTCLGEGSSAVVRKVKGKLKWNEAGELIYVSNKSMPTKSGKAVRSKYVVKIEQHSAQWTREKTLAAYSLARRNKKLGVKYPTFFPAEATSVTVMKRLKDYNLDELLLLKHNNIELFNQILEQATRWELYEILLLEEKGYWIFTIYDRLMYCREILKAYNEQVRDARIEHRDIKIENIMIDVADFIPQVTFFDYGAARDAREEDSCQLHGSLGYLPPEVIKGKGAYTGKSDLYSLGCVLAQLWGDNSASENPPEDDPLGYSQSINRQFNFMEGTPESVKKILSQMVAREPGARPTSDEVLAVIEKEMEALEQWEDFKLSSSSSSCSY